MSALVSLPIGSAKDANAARPGPCPPERPCATGSVSARTSRTTRSTCAAVCGSSRCRRSSSCSASVLMAGRIAHAFFRQQGPSRSLRACLLSSRREPTPRFTFDPDDKFASYSRGPSYAARGGERGAHRDKRREGLQRCEGDTRGGRRGAHHSPGRRGIFGF